LEKTIMEAMIEKDNNFRMIIANMMEAIKPLIAQGILGRIPRPVNLRLTTGNY